MNKLKERLQELMQEHELKTQQQLADFAGVTKGLVGQWFSGQTGLGKKPLLEIDKKTNFSTQWLAEGVGGKYKAFPHHHPLPAVTDSTAFDLLDISASCGAGEAALYDYPEIIRQVQISNDYVKKLFGYRDTGSIKIINSSGDSMTPTIPKNSAVFIDTKSQTFHGDGIYLFYFNGDLYLKRLQKIPGGLLVISDNSRYKPFEIGQEDGFNIIGGFVGTLSFQIE